MHVRTPALIAAVLCLVATHAATAAEFDAAGYHDGNCMQCHGTEVYTRENRRVKSFAALQNQVARCDAMLETKLFPEDLAQLVDHLNQTFYKFSN